MHTVSEAVTKAFTNCLSPLLPVFIFSHSPNRSNPFSIPIISPMIVPKARQSTTSMDFPLSRFPLSICSIPCIAPAIAINRTLIPHAIVSASCCSCLNSLPVKCPITPPATIAALLIIVPSPIMYQHLYHHVTRGRTGTFLSNTAYSDQKTRTPVPQIQE